MSRLLFAVAVLLPLVCKGWAPSVKPSLTSQSFSLMTGLPGEMEQFDSPELDPEDPCWQNIYDDDCAMESAAMAHFKASEWIKSMPCGQGIKDCDMPEAVTVPEVRPHAEVDVMHFLNVKRAKPIGLDKAGEDEMAP